MAILFYNQSATPGPRLSPSFGPFHTLRVKQPIRSTPNYEQIRSTVRRRGVDPGAGLCYRFCG